MRENLASLVETFRSHAGETAVVSHVGVRRYRTTYGELGELAGRFAAELRRRGIAPGERVVLVGANSAAWMGAFFGCLLRGVLAVPLDAAGSRDFLLRVVEDVRPKLIVGDRVLLAGLATGVPILEVSGMESVLPRVPEYAVDASVTGDTPFQIIFTSGTSAEPKGVVHTHRNVLASLGPIETEMEKYRRYERWVHPLRFLHTLPLSHVFGQFMGLWTPGLLGAEVHFVDRMEPGKMVELARAERVSVLVAVPRVLDLMRGYLLRRFPGLEREIEQAGEFSAWKRWWRFRQVHRALGWKFWALISGGASLPGELEQFWNRLGLALIQGYGMTETAALITLNHPFKIGKGSIGKPLPGREVRLAEDGEIMVRGEMVSRAMWRKGRMEQREGEWLATGDLAEESGGEYRFVARRGDAIVTASGLNIFPSDLEAALAGQHGVRACAVVACEVAGGAEPVCVVIFDGGEDALRRAVARANDGLAEYQQIRRVLRWPEVEFPFTSSGKLLRRRIREWACGAIEARGAMVEGRVLLALIAGVTGARVEGGGDDLKLSEDLLLDSMGRVQLASEIEQRMGVELNEDELARMVTVGDLRRAMGVGVTSHSTSGELEPTRMAGADEVVPRYPRWPWMWPVWALRAAVLECVVRPLVGGLLAPRVVGRVGDEVRGPVLIVVNHVNMLDAALVLYGLPGRLRRHVAIAMSAEVLGQLREGRGQVSAVRNVLAPGAYWLLTALFNVFPLPRLAGFRQSFRHAGEAMDRGYSVMIFPEGTRSHGGPIAEFRPGTGLLAAESGVPVLPVALVGLGTLGPGDWLRTGRVEVRVGELISLPEGTSAEDWTAAVERAVRGLAE